MDSPKLPRLRVSAETGPDALVAFIFGAADAVPSAVDCALLAGPPVEAWCAQGDHYAVRIVEATEAGGDIEAATEQAYRRLLAETRPSAHPYLLRIWNYFADINAGEGDHERYRRFCVGRAAAVDEMFNQVPPAATAIGADGAPARLQVVALCAKAPAIALENPRQTPAWRYPREHGPVSPGFSRGAVLDADTATPRLLASGTASIVGHVSQHVGDFAAQLRESLDNLAALLEQGRQATGRGFPLDGCESLRVYLRRPDDLAAAQAILATSGIDTGRVSYLRGDVCRRELDVELEGVFAAS
ncbi:pteridine-dependent deoxygenase like protein [Arenimonas caeni]|uniref:Pteridine-dependent deoxygenase like protein n=1 Tax=Arenimonas caeni TaxID=2058085 RepID=A0A2P6M9D4_9GAMM|nr:pteridine-dependent deoxygenase like protein [Arenimonas caeni]PRH82583.1 pteridine-dependent deoxygenase like protein [Arenimonas caeni]